MEAKVPAMTTKNKKRAGSTLVELMLAIVILLIALIGTSTTYVSGRQQIVKQRYYQIAAHFASQKLEDIKATSYLDLDEGQETEELSLSGTIYKRTTEVVLTAAPSASVPLPCKKVTVTIQWAGPAGDRHEAKLVTYIGP
jgi:type II secretory pathway pseudopilin PulG